MRLKCKLLDVYLPRRRARRPCEPFFCLLVPYMPLALVLLDALCWPYTSARGAGSPALVTLDNACSKLNDFWVDRAAVPRLRAALQLALLSFASHVSSHW